MRGDDPEFDLWVDRARAGSFDAAERLCGFQPMKGEEKRKGWRAGPCPDCGGTDRFAVHAIKRRFRCRHCGVYGRDALALAMVGGFVSFIEACEALSGEPKPSRTRAESEDERTARLARRAAADARAAAEAEQRAREIEEDRQRAIESSDRLWGRGLTLAGSPIADYFSHRTHGALLPPGIENLRYVPDLPYYVEIEHAHGDKVETELKLIHRGPAMLGRIQGPDNHTIGVHRTWFDASFSAARPKGRPLLIHPQSGLPLKTKKILGRHSGGAIRLVRGLNWRGEATGFPGDMIPPLRLFLAEGIETLLSVYAALYADNSPLLDRAAFWCGISLGNLQCIRAPKPIAEVILLGDGDSDPVATRARLDEAKANFEAQGCRVALFMAPSGKDFNDVLREEMARRTPARTEAA